MVLRTGIVNAIALLVGWTLALVLLFLAVVIAFGGDPSTDPSDSQRTAASVVELVVGVGLLAFAVHRWRRRHEATAGTAYPQAVARQLEHLNVRRSAFMGVLIQPRALTVAAALVVARDRDGVFGMLVGFSLFAVASTAALLGILIYAIARPELAALRLTDVVSLLERQAPMILTALFAAGGGYLVFDALWHL